MNNSKNPESAANSPDDPEKTRVVAEEEKTLKRVQEATQGQKERFTRNFDRELIELRDAIHDARLEDVPPLVAEMERMREVANRVAQVPTGKLDTDSPYFGHLRLIEGARARDVLIGNSTYIDIEKSVRVVDWRDAPVSRIYYRYSEGDDFEEEFGGNLVEGRVSLRRNVVIHRGVLRRVVCPQGVFIRTQETWTRGADSTAKLEGGQLSAVRPPTEEERQRLNARKRGKLGIGGEGGREDRHLPDIPALIDPRQFELITKPNSGLVVIQGGAGSGKTTIGLHRMAFLAFNSPARFAPDRMMVVVFNRALASYIVRVLPALGVAGVMVTTYSEWISKQRARHIQGSPNTYSEDTPPVVSRVKKHPVMLRLIAARVRRESDKALAEILLVSRRNGCESEAQKVWDSLDTQPISRRISGVGQWLRGERQVQNLRSGPSLGARTVAEIQRTVDRLMRRARDVAWDFAELITDGDAIWSALEADFPKDFTRAEVAQAVRWSATRCIQWVGVDPSQSEDDEVRDGAREGAREKKTRRDGPEDASRETRGAVEGRGVLDDAELGETLVRTRSERRRSDDDDDGGGDDDENKGPARGIDGVLEDGEALTLDPEDDALLMRIYQVKRGGLRGAGHQLLRYEHLFVDEAQDLSPVELATLMGVSSADQSVTFAGDTAQRLLMDNGFTEWRDVLQELGMNTVEVEPLRIGYRSTQEVLVLAREVLGPLAEKDPPVATRSGAPVEFFGFADVGAAVAFLGESLRTLALSEPRANVAVITRDPARAEVYFNGLKQSEVPRLSWVKDQDFSFRPGVEVTDIRQVKGLEFDYVVLVDVSAGTYTVDDESRHLLHIGATRAAHQLWIVAAGVPSKLIPKYLTDE